MLQHAISLGIDQGLANIGYSICKVSDNKDEEILESGAFTTKSNQQTQDRIKEIYDFIESLLNKYPSIQIIGTENLFYNGATKNGRNKSAAIVSTNMVTGVIMLLASKHNKFIRQYTPGTIKKYVTENSKASKEEVEEGIKQIIINNNIDIVADHHSDAIAISVAAAFELFKHGPEELAKMCNPSEKCKKKNKISIVTKNAFKLEGFSIPYNAKKGEHQLIDLYDTHANQPLIDIMKSNSTKNVVGGMPVLIVDKEMKKCGLMISYNKKSACEWGESDSQINLKSTEPVCFESGEWVIGKFKSKICEASLKNSLKKINEFIEENNLENKVSRMVLIPKWNQNDQNGKYEVWCELKKTA